MRLPVLLAFLTLFASATSVASAAPATSLDVTAQRVNFFSNRYIVTADGDVRVRLSDGTEIRGETFTMDLKLNRYLVAGGVQLEGASVREPGAAFAGYPDLDRSYFLPAGTEPERWTYYGLNWADKHVGREQPGDAFNFPDLTGERPYIVAKGARITPRTNVLFTLPQIYTAGVYLPQPRYVVTFSANSHYFENAFAGARFDVGLPFNGSEHSLTALHVRNDAINGTYLAFDQHFVWPQDWIVFGIDPLTQEQRQYNLIAYKRWSPKVEARLFTQVSAAQRGLIYEAENSAGFGEIQLNAGLRRSGLSYTQDNYYQYLQGLPYGLTDLTRPRGDYDPRWREHPMNATLAWNGFENRLVKGPAPVLFRLRSGLGLAHDQYGEITYPGQPTAPDAWYHYLGGTVYTAPIRLPGRLALTASYDRQRTWFNVAKHNEVAETRLSVSGAQERRHLRYFLAYGVTNIGDYWGDKQLAVYAPNPDRITTAFGTYSGQAAWRGLATQRGYTGSLVFTPTPYFELAGTLARHYDFPAPVPGAYGQPPWQFTGDVRVRLAKQILVDFSRQYFFNFANERWTPQFGIQFSP
ncbi:MAG: hypothetical protein NVS4B13_03400 [Candidatus Elarobacter sp.]